MFWEGNRNVWQDPDLKASTQNSFSVVSPKLKIFLFGTTILEAFFFSKLMLLICNLKKNMRVKKAMFSACLQDSKTKNHEQKPAQNNGSKFDDQRGQQIETF